MRTGYLRERCRSFGHAFRGLWWLLASQANARIHLAATFVVLAAGLWLEVTAGEWLLLGWSLAAVWMAEAFNTALEFLADEVSLEQRDRIGKAKDVAAFAVLVMALAAAATAAVILGGRLLD
jgi:diacylglycerol kinase